MNGLSAADRARLVKLLSLLYSDFAGERDAAGLAATRLLRERALTWCNVLVPPPVKREPSHSTWRKTCAELAKRPGDLHPWERAFVADLRGFPHIWTKQRYVLLEIADRVLGAEAT